jgi:hypothetical protein
LLHGTDDADISARKPLQRVSPTARPAQGQKMKFRWSDWLAAVAVVMALSAFAAAEAVEDLPTQALAR